MKKLLALGVISLGVIGCFTGCASLERDMKTFSSNFNGGLNRTVAVYDSNGNLLKTYEGKIDVQDTEYGNKVLFDLDGKRVVLYNATVIVEEQ